LQGRKESSMKYFEKFIEFSRSSKRIYLCHEFREDKLFELFKPTQSELKRHYDHGYSNNAWGEKFLALNFGEFTPLRQNIVLFMAAINGEL